MINFKVSEQTLRYAKTKKATMLREEEELEKKINSTISVLRLLNNRKTEILWIGACARRQDKLCPEKDLRYWHK